MGTEKMKFYERYKIFIILCFVNIATFMVRFALTVAILDMADPPSKNSTDSKSCPSNHTQPTSQKFTKSSENLASLKFDWTESQQDLLLGSFYYGYTVTVWPFG